ncbi:MAG: hypothetical protein CTY19_16985 [Methylomonas sp.]|jgi:hypothetical protein|nr:MAG: hypothetical protein CTY19_16985 [Methylomonas sp.]
MNDTQTKELFDLLLQIQRDIGALTQQQTALAEQLTGLDQRLAQVEYCVINHYNDFRETGNRSVWTNEQRNAFGEWLFKNTPENDLIPVMQPPPVVD